MVAAVMPSKAWVPSRTWRKNAYGPSSMAAARPSRASMYSRFRCSHISLLICSRMPRAFSRARDRHTSTPLGFAGWACRNSRTPASPPDGKTLRKRAASLVMRTTSSRRPRRVPSRRAWKSTAARRATASARSM